MSDDLLMSLSGVRFGYPRASVFLGPCDLSVRAGTFHAMLGPNGAGKSTLLRLCCGSLRPIEGSVTWRGRDLSIMSERERAKGIAFLPQRLEVPSDLTAREVVMLGRFPVRRTRFFDSPEDECAADDCMATTEVSSFADRRLSDMSGGEAQRVHLAAALAQNPTMLALDEPTSSLDPYHQLEICGLLRDLTRRDGLAVVMVTHDPNLAAQFADVVTLIVGGSIVATGGPAETLTPDVLRDVYGVSFERFSSLGDGQFRVFPSSERTAIPS